MSSLPVLNSAARIQWESASGWAMRKLCLSAVHASSLAWSPIPGCTALKVYPIRLLGCQSRSKRTATPSFGISTSSPTPALRPTSALGAIRVRIRGIDPDLALSDVASMEDRLGDSLWRQRFSAIVVGAFSVAALAIAVLGVFGMTSYVVACRTFEIGVRIAIGATPSDVLRMILGQSVSMALLGVALGLLGSLAVTRVLSTFLFGIQPTDPLTFGGVALLLLAAAAAASYIPSRRAATVDPIVALRME